MTTCATQRHQKRLYSLSSVSVGSSGVCSVLLIFFTVLDLVAEVKQRVTQTCGCEQPQVVEKKVDSNVIITGNVGETGLYLQNCRKNWQLPPSHVSTFQTAVSKFTPQCIRRHSVWEMEE